MRQFAYALLITIPLSYQITVRGVKITGVKVSTQTSGLPTGFAQLPLVWANDHECDPPGGVFDQTKTIPGTYTVANAQNAINDWVADGVDDSWHVVVAHGSVLPPLTFPAKLVGVNQPTKCIVFDSDTPLTAGRTVCTHGIQDNLATSTDPGVRNPDCNGVGMTYQLGQTLTPVRSGAGAFTLANGTATNTSAYNDVASMYAVECNTVNCATIQEGAVDAQGNGPNHFAIYNAEIRINAAQTCCFPVDIENAGVTVASLPSHYHFDRIWVHSDATDAGKGTQGITDYIRINCGGNCSLSNSAGSKGIRPGAEGHGVYFSDGQQIKIVHNWIEGMSIGIMNGGLSHGVPGGVSGRDLEIRRNRLTYPFPWLGVNGICGVGVSCVRKNCFEEKGALRYLFDGNICENVDNTGGQNGTLTDWNNRACTPGPCENYPQTIQDITVTNNIYRHGCGGLLFDANSGNLGSSGNSATIPGRKFLLQNVLFYDISIDNFNCGVSTNGTVYLGGANHDFPVTSVTRNAGGTISTIILTGGTGSNITGLVAGDPITLTGCANATFNAGPYPFVTALTVSGTTITYNNPGTPNATSANCTFNNGAGWPNLFMVDHVTAIADWYVEMGNNLTPSGATFPRNQTYTNSIFSGTRGLGSPGGANEGTNFEVPFLDITTLLIHHSIFSQRVAPVWQAAHAYKLGEVAQPSGSPSHFYTVVTSGTSGGVQPAFPSGTSACIADGTVTWQENGFRMAQTGGLPSYTEYQVLNTPISPPTTLYFPQTDFTFGAVPDATSIGFTGALNSPASGTNTCVSGTPVPGINTALDLSDWHGYVLNAGSTYINKSTTSGPLGVNIPALDTAQTVTKYVCQSACGLGPSTD